MGNSNHNHSTALVFDFGGVLIDWDPRYLYSKLFPGDPQGMENFLREIDFSGWNLHQDAGRSFAPAVAELCERFPQYTAQIRAYDERYEETMSGPIWETVSILESLKDQGLPLYALSNWSAEKFAVVRPKYEFFGWFEGMIISGEVGLIKPDPRIYQRLSELTCRPPQDCLIIDDSPVNTAAAESLGFQAIQFSSPQQLRAELEQRGYRL